MFGKIVRRSAIAAVAMWAMAPANAASFVFAGGNSNLSGAMGNSISLPAVSGITVTATAWSTDAVANTNTPEAAYLGRYDNGLGVTNNNEGTGANYTHVIDNLVSYDFVRLEFSQKVKLTGLTLVGYNADNNNSTPIDTDAWIAFGTGTLAFNTSTLWQNNYLANGTNVNDSAAFSINAFSNVWLVGAARTTTDRNDGFKLSAFTAVAQVPVVPEPATWLTMILGFGVMGGALRRRAKPVLAAA